MPYNVLFADDSLMINEVMEFAFEEDDFNAHFANTYAQVNSKISNTNFDLIIIDIDLNGYNLIDKIKKSEKNKNTEIFFLSENTDIADKKKAKKMGVSGWIVKPFIPEKLVKTLRIHLKKNLSTKI
ncbi:MAG: response regulator [Bacteroidales bacterium]|nr:response regulator [Bacteroidales bacterium]